MNTGWKYLQSTYLIKTYWDFTKNSNNSIKKREPNKNGQNMWTLTKEDI